MSETHVRTATIAPLSLNEANRTVEVIWSTGAPVRRRDAIGPLFEVLSLAPGAVDMSVLAGASVLDAHRQAEVRNVLGVVLSARIDGNRATAVLQFSTRPDVEPVWQDVKAGILRHISCGYTVQAWSNATDPTTRIRTLTATRWTPVEISFVPTPADPGAFVRSGEFMDTTSTTAPADTAPTITPETITRAAPAGSDAVMNRAQTNTEIRSMATLTGLGQSWIDVQIDRGATVEQARSAAFEAMAQRGNAPIQPEQVRVTVGASFDDPNVRCRAMGEALHSRINPGHNLSEQARQYAYASPAEMAKELLHLRGESTTGMSPASIITRSLHTTSDFGIILGDTVGRTLRQSYAAAPAGIRRTARQTTARDFRNKTAIHLSEAPLLERLNESGEIKAGTLAEAKETYRLNTFARKLRISRQALVNDDLGAFTDLSRRFGAAAAETEALELVELLTAAGVGPKMDDGKALFHTAHRNLAAAGATVDDATLSAARLAMRTQIGLTGQTIAIGPKFLVVPAALETIAEKWLATIAPAAAGDVNPFAGRLELVVEPRLDAKSGARWYVVADPAEIDGLEISYLNGAAGPMTEQVRDPDVDGVTLQVIHDFGAGFVEFRSWFCNPGA